MDEPDEEQVLADAAQRLSSLLVASLSFPAPAISFTSPSLPCFLRPPNNPPTPLPLLYPERLAYSDTEVLITAQSNLSKHTNRLAA